MSTSKNNTVPNNAVIYQNKYVGYATPSYFASTAFIESDERYSEIVGMSFGWFDFEDQTTYKSSKFDMKRPTLDEWNTLFSDEQREIVLKNL
jgi:hypothetical protein